MEHGVEPRLKGLMIRLAAGDRSALHPAFAILWPLLRRFTGRHLAPAEAEDAAQEAAVKIFGQAPAFDASRSAVAWVLGVAGYEVLTARRRRKRRREEPADAARLGGRPDPGPDPEESALSRDLEATLEAALGSLGPEDATTLRLYARGDRPAIAAATFRKRVERALARLRTAWRTTDERT
jgi:RNA polymerase sigma factor (sigma-70 family)